jgi:hypothetical protein
MKLAAMQPYFFPYLGQFDLLNMADMWIAYDPAQFIRHGWVNRNRVLHPTSGWQYIIVPVKKHSRITPINQIEIAGGAWKTQIFKQLQHYRIDAPFYGQVIRFLEEVFAEDETSLAKLNSTLFRKTARRLGIQTPVYIFSELGRSIEPARGPENLALEICRAVGASEYINSPGGVHLYSPERFVEHGVRLTIQTFTTMPYSCGRFQFEPNLSIIDVMMWNSPEQIKHYLDTFRLNTGNNRHGDFHA